ncbi:MAG: hypothetical protein FWH36_06855 [Lentimicrobiaceae bacterium]|nr:hypothetical protein [Lentimicrobiaceae bacterium]
MLYKYLFYSVSYLVKKYDHLWNVGDTYYVGGAMAIGLTIGTCILNLLDIIGIFFLTQMLWHQFDLLSYLPLLLGLLFVFIFGYKKRHIKIYEEVKNMDLNRKKKYKILNIIHIFLVWGLFFNMKSIFEAICN